MDSAKIIELDARYLASVMKVRFFPLVIASADGCRITDTSGVTRLDFSAGWAVANLGYGNARVREAVTGALATTTANAPHQVHLSFALVNAAAANTSKIAFAPVCWSKAPWT